MKWDVHVFPYLRYWAHNDEEMYTVALEPASAYFSDIRDALEHGDCLTLEPGEEQETWVKCVLYEGDDFEDCIQQDGFFIK